MSATPNSHQLRVMYAKKHRPSYHVAGSKASLQTYTAARVPSGFIKSLFIKAQGRLQEKACQYGVFPVLYCCWLHFTLWWLAVNPFPLAHYQACSLKVHPSRTQPKTPITIQVHGSSVQGAAELTHMPDNITVLEGDSVTLRCQIDEEVTHKAWLNRSNIMFTGRDKWTLDKRVTLLNNNSSDFSIHINKVQVTDEGPYTCTFQANNKPRLTHVYLIVQDPPMITDVKNMPAHVGKTVILRCEAMAVPAATFEWYRDDHRPVESDNNLRVKHEKTRSLLLFSNVTEKHFGNYTCFASNRLGTSNASMLLFRPVHIKPPSERFVCISHFPAPFRPSSSRPPV
ncbi:hypothetical protein WMY93_025707 [Mugilogobius chulae]|uniref:Ig-like domain-containing protein n=1 Tax=Mugilogobius chulae TaxID=88201 RepID=A0AAW0N051_9GOBI